MPAALPASLAVGEKLGLVSGLTLRSVGPAVAVACALALLGVPLAVVARGARGSAYLITLGTFVLFYALSRFSLGLAESGLNAWVAGLLPDAVVLSIGGSYTRDLVLRGIGKPR